MSEFKFNCPYCLQKFASDSEDIGKAAICPFCQKEITITPPLGHDSRPKGNTLPPKTAAKNDVKGTGSVLVVIASLVGLIMWIYYCWTAPPKNVNMSSVPSSPQKVDIMDAWNAAKRAVCDELQRPEAAKFPHPWDNGCKIYPHDDTTYAIMGFVDTDLPSKGKFRLYWFTKVQYRSSGKWDVDPVGWLSMTRL